MRIPRFESEELVFTHPESTPHAWSQIIIYDLVIDGIDGNIAFS
jgi:hypothetical protein